MKQMLVVLGMLGMVVFAAFLGNAWAQVAKDMAAKSPWGPLRGATGSPLRPLAIPIER